MRPLLGPAFPVLFNRLRLRAVRRLRLDLWFPHVPLALAVGVAGALALLPTLRHLALIYLHLHLGGVAALQPFSTQLTGLSLRGLPTLVGGFMQVITGIGLLFRSRLAWIAALLLAAAQLTLGLGLRHVGWGSALVLYDGTLLLALLASGRAFTRSSLAAGTLIGLAATVLLLAYGILGSLVLGQGFAPPIATVTQAAYFTVVTMSTVGYGDILPKTDNARLFVISLIVVGLTVFLTSLTAALGPLIQGRLSRIIEPRRKRMKRVNHYIITGDGPLAHNTARELLARDKSVVVICEEPDASFDDAEVVAGDPTDLDTLRLAGAETAHAVLALSEDDAENAFVILALRELPTEARKVAAVGSRKNLERVRRVQPDMILAPNVFGGEVLAMALADEKIDGDQLLARFLDAKPRRE